MNSNTEQMLDLSNIAAITHVPTPMAADAPVMSDTEKMAHIATHFEEIMRVLGLDLEDDSLVKTPQRVAKMYVKEIFSGLNTETFPQMSFFEDRSQMSELGNPVFTRVHFTSFCEHHFVPFSGTATIGYVPNGKLIGLSKIPRLVRFFARRPQVQERLTAQIADSLATLLETEDIAVSLSAQHFCVIARGIEDTESHTTTNSLRGKFAGETNLRQEFFQAMQ